MVRAALIVIGIVCGLVTVCGAAWALVVYALSDAEEARYEAEKQPFDWKEDE